MNRVWPVLYFGMVALVHGLGLYARLYLPGMSGGGLTGLLLLVTLPFALLAIVWPGLRPGHFIWFLAFNLCLQLIFYTATGFAGIEIFQLHLTRYGFWPILQSQGVLLGFGCMVGLGLHMKTEHGRLILRRRGTDKEELENLYELKRTQIPEEGLTFFRYRQLLSAGIGLVASRGIQILASMQVLPRHDAFFLYDLVGGPNTKDHSPGILFLFEELFNRPEIQLNRPERIVYLFRKSDERLRLLLEEYNFERVALDNPAVQEWNSNLRSLLKTKFEDWTPFDDLECYYVKIMEQSLEKI